MYYGSTRSIVHGIILNGRIRADVFGSLATGCSRHMSIRHFAILFLHHLSTGCGALLIHPCNIHLGSIPALASNVLCIGLFLSDTSHSMHTRPWTHIWIRKELVQHPCPRGVLIQILIILWSNLSQLVQPRLRNLREIMMLVMISNIITQRIQWTIITVRLLSRLKHVMLRNQMPSQGMDTSPKNRSSKQVYQGLDPPEIQHCRIRSHHKNPVHNITHVCLLWPHKQWPDAIDNKVDKSIQQLHTQPSDPRRLQNSWKVHITPINTQEQMMIVVILSKLDSNRNHKRHVGHQRQ
mmetsp:Transcript_7108/g.14185  ORF Transcript_7108/g.14185 Transcript_7108/m.14185 type:complete len:294 (-) Transcript_7108:418-1299(-)